MPYTFSPVACVQINFIKHQKKYMKRGKKNISPKEKADDDKRKENGSEKKEPTTLRKFIFIRIMRNIIVA